MKEKFKPNLYTFIFPVKKIKTKKEMAIYVHIISIFLEQTQVGPDKSDDNKKCKCHSIGKGILFMRFLQCTALSTYPAILCISMISVVEVQFWVPYSREQKHVSISDTPYD